MQRSYVQRRDGPTTCHMGQRVADRGPLPTRRRDHDAGDNGHGASPRPMRHTNARHTTWGSPNSHSWVGRARSRCELLKERPPRSLQDELDHELDQQRWQLLAVMRASIDPEANARDSGTYAAAAASVGVASVASESRESAMAPCGTVPTSTLRAFEDVQERIRLRVRRALSAV
jgi:hypothetical protein